MVKHRGTLASLVLGAAAAAAAIAAGALVVVFAAPGAPASSPPTPPADPAAVAHPTTSRGPGWEAPPYVTQLKIAGPAVLHWETATDNANPQSIDAFEGKKVFGDLWLEVDASGIPVKYAAQFTLQDGTPVQQIYEDASTTTVVMDRPQRGLPIGVPAASCTISNTPTDSGTIEKLLPSVIAPSALLAVGDTVVPAPTVELPSPAPIPNAEPRATFPAAPATGLQLVSPSGSGGSHVSQTFIETSTHRVVGVDNVTRDATGNVVSEYSNESGPIEVYTTPDVPASVFAMPSEGCK